MVSSYVSRLGRSYLYRLKLIEDLPKIEAALASYMARYDLKRIRVNGYFIEQSDDCQLGVYEAPPLEDHQLALDLGF